MVFPIKPKGLVFNGLGCRRVEGVGFRVQGKGLIFRAPYGHCMCELVVPKACPQLTRSSVVRFTEADHQRDLKERASLVLEGVWGCIGIGLLL